MRKLDAHSRELRLLSSSHFYKSRCLEHCVRNFVDVAPKAAASCAVIGSPLGQLKADALDLCL